MGFGIKFEMNATIRERMNAGLAFIYTTRDGHKWYIDACLNFPFRQIDLSECMYDAFDGHDFEPGYPSLSVCQYALEEGCPPWRGVGWYSIGNGDDVSDCWIEDIGELKEKVADVRVRFDVYGEPWVADYMGDGAVPI